MEVQRVRTHVVPHSSLTDHPSLLPLATCTAAREQLLFGLVVITVVAGAATIEPAQQQALNSGSDVPARGRNVGRVRVLHPQETDADLSSGGVRWVMLREDKARNVLAKSGAQEGDANAYLIHSDLRRNLPQVDRLLWLFDGDSARARWQKLKSAPTISSGRHTSAPSCRSPRKWCEVPADLVAAAGDGIPSVQVAQLNTRWMHLFIVTELRLAFTKEHMEALLLELPSMLVGHQWRPPCVAMGAGDAAQFRPRRRSGPGDDDNTTTEDRDESDRALNSEAREYTMSPEAAMAAAHADAADLRHTAPIRNPDVAQTGDDPLTRVERQAANDPTRTALEVLQVRSVLTNPQRKELLKQLVPGYKGLSVLRSAEQYARALVIEVVGKGKEESTILTWLNGARTMLNKAVSIRVQTETCVMH